MFAFSRRDNIGLPPTRGSRTQGTSHAKQYQFRYVAKVEANTSPIGSAVLAYLVPNKIGLVGESPTTHDLKPLKYECIRNPKIEMASLPCELSYRQFHYLLKGHRRIPAQSLVLRRHLASSVLKTPRRIRQYSSEGTGETLQQLHPY